MKKKINLNSGHFILLIAVFVIIYLCFKDIYIKNLIEKNGKNIVVKFTSKVVMSKTTNFYFTYFVDGKKISTANAGVNYNISDSKEENKTINNLKLNTFYLAKSISRYPNIIIVNPLANVTDTTAILKAGFSREDISNSTDLSK